MDTKLTLYNVIWLLIALSPTVFSKYNYHSGNCTEYWNNRTSNILIQYPILSDGYTNDNSTITRIDSNHFYNNITGYGYTKTRYRFSYKPFCDATHITDHKATSKTKSRASRRKDQNCISSVFPKEISEYTRNFSMTFSDYTSIDAAISLTLLHCIYGIEGTIEVTSIDFVPEVWTRSTSNGLTTLTCQVPKVDYQPQVSVYSNIGTHPIDHWIYRKVKDYGVSQLCVRLPHDTYGADLGNATADLGRSVLQIKGLDIAMVSIDNSKMALSSLLQGLELGTAADCTCNTGPMIVLHANYPVIQLLKIQQF